MNEPRLATQPEHEALNRALRAVAEAGATPVYRERNLLVLLLATHYPAFLERDASRTDDKQMTVVLETEVGSLRWHITDSELKMFQHLPERSNTYSGDPISTEEKYARIKALAARSRG